MTRILLAWQPLPAPQGTSFYPHDLSEPEAVVALFRAASRFRAHVTAQGWRFLWANYDLAGLLELNRQAGWFDSTDDREAAEQLIHRARVEGFDPVSGQLRGDFERNDQILELV
ncbi:MAG TPA: hypothetical protein VH475_09675 [Tepidisphaeraceae bacterium]|jgi:hypothetical protein